MWAFLSRRFGRWLMIAVLLPVARAAVHRAAGTAVSRRPYGRTSRALAGADRALSRTSRRTRRRAGGRR